MKIFSGPKTIHKQILGVLCCYNLFLPLAMAQSVEAEKPVVFTNKINSNETIPENIGTETSNSEVPPTPDNPAPAPSESSSNNEQIYPYQQTFTITAYYSPIEGQKRYIRGSLAADKKLNGRGTNGADGTPVYPGMIAAPKSIAFGTKMDIPGLGTVAVHDRGGAIVPAGERGQRFDRLDVWMGYGDEGLNRALRWGRRNVNVTVHGQNESIAENIDLSSISGADLPINTTSNTSSNQEFGLDDENEQISQIKRNFAQLKYYQGEINNQFDENLRQAVVKFQLEYEVIDQENDFGAGYFGPQTRKTLEKALQGLSPAKNHQQNLIPLAQASPRDQIAQNIEFAGNGLAFLDDDLSLGDSGQAVIELQTELAKLNLFGLTPTGYYGELTAHAVYKFQQSRGIVINKEAPGAGAFGPSTRAQMTIIVSSRIENRRLIAQKSPQLLAQK